MKNRLSKLIIEAIEEEELDSAIEGLKRDLLLMQKEDPRAYKDWKQRVLNLGQDLSADLRQAIRWNETD